MNCIICQNCQCKEGKECTQGYDLESYREHSKNEYHKAENQNIFEVSSIIEAVHYGQWNRLEEIIGLAEKLRFEHIGIAHCIGLTAEAKSLYSILARKFKVSAICCKFSGIDKKRFNFPQIDKSRYEAICNPIGQAMVLNDLKTDMNIMVGLCVGHDMLFTKYAEAPVTTFIVKDRVTKHNPAAIMYSNYYKNKF